MLSIVGLVIVFVGIIGGYLMEHGNLHILFQPAEFMILYGAAIGVTMISAPGAILPGILKSFGKAFKDGPKKGDFLDLLGLLYELFARSRKEGILSLEKDVEQPESSAIFSAHSKVIADKQLLNYICDNFRLIIMGVPSDEVGELLELDLDASKKEALYPAQTIAKTADALPGLGIVAAVLGVVITMGKINEPPEVLGHSIAAALVGTFLGILSCYGVLAPIATNIEHKVKEREIFFSIVKTAVERFESNPNLIVEIARREIPESHRPTFKELEDYIKGAKGKKE